MRSCTLSRRGRVAGRCAAAAVLLSLHASALAAQAVEVVPVDTRRWLELPFAGVAVVRDSARWATLWARFGTPAYDAAGRLRRDAPAVDFRRHMVLVVTLGPVGSGCSNAASYVREVVERRDFLLVRLGPGPRDDDPYGLTCPVVVHPHEVVRLPRSTKPVRFRAPVGWVPEHTPWWDRPTLAELDGMDEHVRAEFVRALARDPGTPHRTLAGIAERLPLRVHDVVGPLLEHASVRRDPSVMTTLASLHADGARDARRVLFDEHGLALARDSATSAAVVRLLLDEFILRDPPPVDVGRALVRNPRLREDRQMMFLLIRELHPHPALRGEACRAYLARFPAWGRIRTVDGEPTDQWISLVPCPDLPPPPSAGSESRGR